MRKSHMLGAVVAVVVVLTIWTMTSVDKAALAHGPHIDFNTGGFVGFVGISQDPDNPTSVTSRFRFDKRGAVKQVEIKTTNEMVLGVLSNVPNCEGPGCDDLITALTGAPFTSLHASKATLRVSSQGIRSYSLPTPTGPMPLVAELITGSLTGKLAGTVEIGSGQTVMYGETDLQISGSASYACFSPFLVDFGVTDAMPGPMQPCKDGEGQLFPIDLLVTDTGSIAVGDQVTGKKRKRTVLSSAAEFGADLTVVVESHVNLNRLVRGDATAFRTSGEITVSDATGTFGGG